MVARRPMWIHSKDSTKPMDEVWKILLIDDDPGIRRIMSLALGHAGYSVVTAADGPTGIRLCQEASAQIIITDVGMPGMDGLEVLKRIKEIDPDREVIVTTAFTEMDLAIRALQLDAGGFLVKPVSDDALGAALERAKERYRRRKDIIAYTTLIEERWMDTADELARMFHFQKMLIESSIDGIAACDHTGKVIIYNPSLERLLGYPKASVIGKMSVLDFFAPGQAGPFQDRLYSEETSRRDRLFPFATEVATVEGRRISVVLSAKVLFYDDEQLGMVIHFRDLNPLPES
jgi:two-component system, NtrC family, sensor kinase